jgi:hypothetical protein
MRLVATFACLLVCGCTRANSDYIADSGIGGDNDFGLADLGATPGTPCSGDARACLGTAASGFCSGGTLALDRTCPSQSSCAATYCAPPASRPGSQVGERCDSGGAPADRRCLANLADMLTCQPFVNPGTHKLAWFCAPAVGSGSTRCTRGADCRSGVCADTGSCFAGCPGGFSVHVTVEGVTESAKSCTL